MQLHLKTLCISEINTRCVDEIKGLILFSDTFLHLKSNIKSGKIKSISLSYPACAHIAAIDLCNNLRLVFESTSGGALPKPRAKSLKHKI